MNGASGRSSGREKRPAQKKQPMPFHPEVRQKQIDEARKRNAREAKQHRQKQKQIAQKKIDEARHVAAAKEASAAHEVDKANVEIHKRQKKIITDEEARMMKSPVY